MTPEEYAKQNPLGGPAKMFRAIADRIQAGEDYYAVLADYGLRHSEAVGRVPPLDITKIPDGFRGVVWFRADGIYTMGEHGWERYSPSAPEESK